MFFDLFLIKILKILSQVQIYKKMRKEFFKHSI